MTWNLPLSTNVNGVEYPIRENCDYRIVLDAISALTDNELNIQQRMQCALFIFYEDLTSLKDIAMKDKAKHQEIIKQLFEEMCTIINYGEKVDNKQKPQFMDWKHDFPQLAPPISRVLGYSVRDVKNYTHYYDFIGAYMEIGECVFSNIISIRHKKMKGQKLEKNEEEFYRNNRKMIDLPQNLTDEEKEWLDSDW